MYTESPTGLNVTQADLMFRITARFFFFIFFFSFLFVLFFLFFFLQLASIYDFKSTVTILNVSLNDRTFFAPLFNLAACHYIAACGWITLTACICANYISAIPCFQFLSVLTFLQAISATLLLYSLIVNFASGICCLTRPFRRRILWILCLEFDALVALVDFRLHPW